MPTKEQIINNIREFSASDIVHAIKCGEVTMYELSKSGKLTPLLKKRIEEQLSAESGEEVVSPSNENIEPPMSESQVPHATEIAVEQMNNSLTDADITSAPPVLPSNTPLHSTEMFEDVIDNKGMFKRIFSFKGRIRRTEYILSYIVFIIWYFIFLCVTEMNDVNTASALFITLTMVPAYWFLWAQGAKRCHDRGNSGWYQIIPFYFFVMLFGGSEEGINDYGTNPKE